jgi:hypothetical protein
MDIPGAIFELELKCDAPFCSSTAFETKQCGKYLHDQN